MIEINLIPDVKREMLRMQRLRNITVTVSIFVALGSVGVTALLGLLVGAQALHDVLARSQIKSEFSKLQSTPDIDNALTIQSQLSKLTELNQQKTMDSRLLAVLNAIYAANVAGGSGEVKYSMVRLNPIERTFSIEGTADKGFIATENFTKSIKSAKVEYRLDNETVSVPLTSQVTMGATTYGQSSDGTTVLSFSLSFVYPEGLFDNTLSNVNIVTPQGRVDVTDSRLRMPSSLFTDPASPATSTGGNN